MQGALSKQWLYPLQEGGAQQMAAGWLARREPLHTDHTCVAALANGITNLCTAPWSDPRARALWHDLWVKGRASTGIYYMTPSVQLMKILT